MDSTIIAAIISAASSILIAFVGRNGRSDENDINKSIVIPNRNKKVWLIGSFLMMCWLLFAAFFLHWDLAGMSGLLIPVVVLIFSFLFPIKPSMASATALFLFPFAFLAEPIGKWKRGLIFDNHFEPGVIMTFLVLAFGTALIAWFINRYRLKSIPVTIANLSTDKEDKESAPQTPLAKQISEIAELHKQGILSDAEFAEAKRKLLSE